MELVKKTLALPSSTTLDDLYYSEFIFNNDYGFKIRPVVLSLSSNFCGYINNKIKNDFTTSTSY